MELTNEDTLRLNVLLANKPQAIRIDESSMTVLGLTRQREVRVQLNPTGRSEPYLRKVRELLSGHVLTVHHLDGDKANCTIGNLVALCQKCHLRIQAAYVPGQLTLPGYTPQWMVRRGLI